MAWTDWLQAELGRTHSVALLRLMGALFSYLVGVEGLEARRVAKTMLEDYRRGGRNDVPKFMRPHLREEDVLALKESRLRIPKRQARHL